MWKNSSCDPLLVLEKLDVVDEQHAVPAVALLEGLDSLLPDRVDEVVRQRLAGDVAHREAGGVFRGHVAGDRLEQVRLAETRSAVDEEWVVGAPGLLRHGERGRVGKTVGRADDERVERVSDVQPFDTRGRLLGGGRVDLLADEHAHAARGPEQVSRRGTDEIGEVPVDPAAGEVVRNFEGELVLLEIAGADVAEPGVVRLVADGLADTVRDLGPDVLRAQLQALVQPSASSSPQGLREGAIIAAPCAALNAASRALPHARKAGQCRRFGSSTELSTAVDRWRDAVRIEGSGLWIARR